MLGPAADKLLGFNRAKNTVRVINNLVVVESEVVVCSLVLWACDKKVTETDIQQSSSLKEPFLWCIRGQTEAFDKKTIWVSDTLSLDEIVSSVPAVHALAHITSRLESKPDFSFLQSEISQDYEHQLSLQYFQFEHSKQVTQQQHEKQLNSYADKVAKQQSLL